MDNSSNNKSNDFYSKTFLEKEILNNIDKENSNNLSKNNNNNCFILCTELKKKIQNIINVIESNINNWEREIIHHFKKAKTEIKNIKECINNLFYNEIETGNKTVKNERQKKRRVMLEYSE